MDDDQAVRAVLAGRTDEFRRLVERYHPQLLRFARNLLGDRSRADDVAQEAFLAAFRNLARFDSKRGRFATWLFAIARNRCANELRDTHPGERAAPDVVAAVERSELERGETTEELERAFAELPAEQRSAFLLAEVEGLPLEEIARVEQVPVGTVKSRIHRAREKLRGRLARIREESR